MDENFLSSFELIAETKLNDCIPIKKYKSTFTGLTVVLADIEGPIVSGKFIVFTEASDNDGLPHTLEHLISLGSEEYPFKGVLDLVANRCLASGTNAWTDDEHTCYTIECVGSEGFLQVLPIYMDHILYPLLTDAAFTTEVHHITGEGKDGGVVYCEMQGVENTGDSLTWLKMLKELYPGTRYAVNSGGAMENLRTSTSNEKIKKFHKKFYRADNFTIIIAGQVQACDVFNALIPIEKKILSKGEQTEKRLSKSSVDPFCDSKIVTLKYPDDEETNGIVAIGYRGPHLPSNLFLYQACNILLRYLSDTTTSPLTRDMVEINDPYASCIGSCACPISEALVRCYFANVPLKKIDEIQDKYFSVLSKIASGEEFIDMKRMKEIIEKEIIENLNSMETYPHCILASYIIYHKLFEDYDNVYFEPWLNPNRYLNDLLSKDESFWIDILQTYLIDAKHVLVKGLPSIEEKKRLANEDKIRIEKRKEELGAEGLLAKEKILQEAIDINNIPPPEEIISSVSIPSVEKINNHPVEIYRITDDEKPNMPEFDQFPVYTKAIDIHSNFIYVILAINTTNIPLELRRYFRLYMELLAKSPILRDNEVISTDEVVNQFDSVTISCSKDIGYKDCGYFFCGDFSSHLFFELTVEPKKYEDATKLFVEILNNTIFDKDRVNVTVNRLLNSISDIKREGFCMVMAMGETMIYKKTSNNYLISVLRQKQFLTEMLKKLEDPTEEQEVLNDLKIIQKTLMQESNISLHIASNWKQMSTEIDFTKSFKMLIDPTTEDKYNRKVFEVPSQYDLINQNENEKPNRFILGLGAVESTYLYAIFPTNIHSLDPDYSSFMLLGEYFTQVEGPFYREIRGKGYSYGYDIGVQPINGLLTFHLYMATNLPAAFKAAKDLIENQISKENVWDPNLLQSARNSLISKIVGCEESLRGVVSQAVISSFKNVSVKHNRELIEKVVKLTEVDLQRVGEKYMKMLFEAESRIAIVCHPDKANEIQTKFREMGYSFEIEESLENSILT